MLGQSENGRSGKRRREGDEDPAKLLAYAPQVPGYIEAERGAAGQRGAELAAAAVPAEGGPAMPSGEPPLQDGRRLLQQL